MISNDSDIQALVHPQLAALADALADQPSTVTDAPSLCEGWAVKHVVAHMTMPARYDVPAFLQELASAGNDFDVLSETVARRDGSLPFTDLLADLRSDIMAVWTPPRGGAMGALTHAVIHGLDITSAIGLPRTADNEATQLVLDAMTNGAADYFGTNLSGRLQATDLDWKFGEGELLKGPAADLVLALAGRLLPGLNLKEPH